MRDISHGINKVMPVTFSNGYNKSFTEPNGLDYDEVSRNAVNMLLQRIPATPNAGGKRWWGNLVNGLTLEREVYFTLTELPFLDFTWDGLQDYLRTLHQKQDYKSTRLDFNLQFKQGYVIPIEAKNIHVQASGEPYGITKANELMLQRVSAHPPHEAHRGIPNFILQITEPEAFNSQVHAEVKRRGGTIVKSTEQLKATLEAINRKLTEKNLPYYPTGVVDYSNYGVNRILNSNDGYVVSKTINFSGFSSGIGVNGLNVGRRADYLGGEAYGSPTPCNRCGGVFCGCGSKIINSIDMGMVNS